MTIVASPVWSGKQFKDKYGDLLANGLLYTYEYNAENPFVNEATTYADNGSTLGEPSPNTNPIVLNISGLMSTGFWLVEGQSYDFLLKDTDGNTVDFMINILA